MYSRESDNKKRFAHKWLRQRIKSGATKYCSLKCQHAFQFQQRVRALEDGLYPAPTTSGFLRRYLVRILGEACVKCGWDKRHPTIGRVIVEVEHIGGDWTNSNPANLTLLCLNCQAMTPTFRALNKGRGRRWRDRPALYSASDRASVPTRASVRSRSIDWGVEEQGPNQLSFDLPT